ncbi:TPA: ABC transporter ATP-binding protein, partial [Streptococcus pyogenes]
MTQQSMLLSIEQVNKSYGKNQVLSDISFDIYKGEICGLVGQNGAG